jgi:signal transduction histidine kinase
MSRRFALPSWSQRPAAQDTVLAALTAVACVLPDAPGAIVKSTNVGLHTGWWTDRQGQFWWLVTVLAGCAIALRRRWPLPMLALSGLSVVVTVAVALPMLYTDVSVLVLLYTVAVRHERGVSLAALTALIVLAAAWCMYGVVFSGPAPSRPDASAIASTVPGTQRQSVIAVRGGDGLWGTGWTSLLLIGSGLLAAWALGAGARNRQAYLDQSRARAQDLERDRHCQAELAVAAERARISRELHDVVAHGFSVIVLQAQGGAAALAARPGDTESALEAIVRTGRESLTELRRVLAGMGVDDAWHPRHGVAHLSSLLDQVRRAGTPVELRIAGQRAPLPSTVDLAAYRIVQEALTNTMKHASEGATAEVTLQYRPAALDVDVADTGRGPWRADGGGGNGLRGMAERVRLLGGTLTTGPVPDGGFRVHAVLPTQDDPR